VDDQNTHPEKSLRSLAMPSPQTSEPLSRRLAGGWRRLRRLVLARRRLLAAGLAGLAVLTGVRAASLPPVDTVPVLVAADDLAGGATVAADDLTTVDLPEESVPAGAVTAAEDVDGRTLAAPVRRGEPLTDVRLLAPGILAGYPGMVAAPVRVADPAAVRLLSVGDRIDLVAVAPDGGPASVVAASVPVVAVPGSAPAGAAEDGLVGGALVVVAVPEDGALALAEASVRAVISVVLRD